MYDVYKILRGLPCTLLQGTQRRGDGAASALLCKRYYLNGIIPPAPGQLCNISIILWGLSNCCNPTSSLLRFIPALQQAICTIRDICWRAYLDGIWPGH